MFLCLAALWLPLEMRKLLCLRQNKILWGISDSHIYIMHKLNATNLKKLTFYGSFAYNTSNYQSRFTLHHMSHMMSILTVNGIQYNWRQTATLLQNKAIQVFTATFFFFMLCILVLLLYHFRISQAISSSLILMSFGFRGPDYGYLSSNVPVQHVDLSVHMLKISQLFHTRV